MNYTVGKLASMFNLSRSTLLYYDREGLLSPQLRSEAGYRIYSEDDRKRLEQIIMLRSFGMPVKEINEALKKKGKQLYSLLENQFHQLNEEILKIKHQQRLLVSILKDPQLLSHSAGMTKEKWTGLLKASGLSETDMNRWHKDFECNDPEKHQEFLEFLGIPETEIMAIRRNSRNNDF